MPESIPVTMKRRIKIIQRVTNITAQSRATVEKNRMRFPKHGRLKN